MIEIPLTQGKVAIVDDCDAHLAAFRWHAVLERGRLWYATRSVVDHSTACGRRHVRLHRVILGVTDPEIEVDHRNGDGLDCRRANLRPATTRQNQGNQALSRRNSSGFKGVHWKERIHRWSAQIRIPGRKYRSLGTFATAEQAARAYDEAARAEFGEFACVNFPRGGERSARPNTVKETPPPAMEERNDDR